MYDTKPQSSHLPINEPGTSVVIDAQLPIASAINQATAAVSATEFSRKKIIDMSGAVEPTIENVSGAADVWGPLVENIAIFASIVDVLGEVCCCISSLNIQLMLLDPSLCENGVLCTPLHRKGQQ